MGRSCPGQKTSRVFHKERYRYKYNSDLFLILPGTEIAAVLFDEKDGYLKMHHLNGILGTKAMQEQAKSGLFQHMERIEPIVAYGDWDGRKVTEAMAENLRDHGCFIHSKSIITIR